MAKLAYSTPNLGSNLDSYSGNYSDSKGNFLKKLYNIAGSAFTGAKNAILSPVTTFILSDKDNQYVTDSVNKISQTYRGLRNQGVNDQSTLREEVAKLVNQYSHAGSSNKLKKAIQKKLVKSGTVSDAISKVADICYKDQKNHWWGLTTFGYNHETGKHDNFLKSNLFDKRARARDTYKTAIMYSSTIASGGLSGLLGFSAYKGGISGAVAGLGTSLKEFGVNLFGKSDNGRKLQDAALKIGESTAFGLDLGLTTAAQYAVNAIANKYDNNKKFLGMNVKKICENLDQGLETYLTGRLLTSAGKNIASHVSINDIADAMNYIGLTPKSACAQQDEVIGSTSNARSYTSTQGGSEINDNNDANIDINQNNNNKSKSTELTEFNPDKFNGKTKLARDENSFVDRINYQLGIGKVNFDSNNPTSLEVKLQNYGNKNLLDFFNNDQDHGSNKYVELKIDVNQNGKFNDQDDIVKYAKIDSNGNVNFDKIKVNNVDYDFNVNKSNIQVGAVLFEGESDNATKTYLASWRAAKNVESQTVEVQPETSDSTDEGKTTSQPEKSVQSKPDIQNPIISENPPGTDQQNQGTTPLSYITQFPDNVYVMTQSKDGKHEQQFIPISKVQYQPCMNGDPVNFVDAVDSIISKIMGDKFHLYKSDSNKSLKNESMYTLFAPVEQGIFKHNSPFDTYAAENNNQIDYNIDKMMQNNDLKHFIPETNPHVTSEFKIGLDTRDYNWLSKLLYNANYPKIESESSTFNVILNDSYSHLNLDSKINELRTFLFWNDIDKDGLLDEGEIEGGAFMPKYDKLHQSIFEYIYWDPVTKTVKFGYPKGADIGGPDPNGSTVGPSPGTSGTPGTSNNGVTGGQSGGSATN